MRSKRERERALVELAGKYARVFIVPHNRSLHVIISFSLGIVVASAIAKINNLKRMRWSRRKFSRSTREFCDSQFFLSIKFHNSKVDWERANERKKAAGESENYYDFFRELFSASSSSASSSSSMLQILLRNNDEYF